MEEVWKDVVGFEGIYQISNNGKLRSLDRIVVAKAGWVKREKGMDIKTNTIQNSGYVKVDLHKNGKAYGKLLHRLVAEAFIENPRNYPQINHKDQNKLNNSADNLEWCTQMYNNHYGDCMERGAETQRRKFYQKDLDGNVVKIWSGFKKMQRETGYQRKTVYLCCIGKRDSYMGYKWEYAD